MKKILFLLSIVLCATVVAQDRSIRPEAGPAPEIRLGSTESFVMDNGLKVFVVENHKLPKVSLSLQFKYHPELEGDAAGVSSIAGDLLGTKTASRSKDEIDVSVDYVGASLHTSSTGIYASSLKKHLPTLMDLFSDVILNSEFTKEEFEKIITQNKSGLASSLDDPDQIAANVTDVMNFGPAHIYGELMTEKTLSTITLEDCQNFHQTYFSPKGSYLAIVGDITIEEAKVLMNKYMASWEVKVYENATYSRVKAPKENKVALVNKAGAVQSVINVTYPIDIHPASEDALKVKVLNNILGGGSSGRLYKNLREDKAYTYGAYSEMSIDETGSYFNASAKVRNEVTDSAIVELLKEMNELRDVKVSQEELQGVINNMSGKFAIALENPSTVARFAINTDYLGLAPDHYATYLQRLSSITVGDIHEVAQNYLKPNNAHIVVVGDVDYLTEKLEVFGAVTLCDNYGVEKSDLKAVYEGVNPETVIADYIVVLGGEKNLEKLNSLEFQYSAEVPGAPAKMEMEVLQQRPNSFSMSMNMMGMTVQRQYSNGTNGFNEGMQGKVEMTAEELAEVQQEYELASELNYFDKYTAELKGVDVLDGEEVYVLIRTDATGNKTTECYSLASKFLVKSESVLETPQGEMIQITLYNDYQTVKGYSFPHQTIQSVAGQTLDMKLEKVIVNKKIDPKKFE
jgi:zinc protease